MELRKDSYIEQETIGDFQQITSSIRPEDINIALDMVSRNLYSNPIGSFVRELVSNAVDANKDNDSSELVKVNIYKEGGQWYFQVKDEGKGMTPEHFENVYMKWFNSDKRNSNDKIGGWGIGSKSPLSYKENYEITTISEGYEYEYIIVRQSPAPTATLLIERPTNKKSGTTVRVEIDEKDLFKLHEECKRQLVYFNNVYLINECYYYENHFNIIEADLFKVRTDTFPFGREMHIVLGQVAYPINWNFLGISPINIPVGLKFEIGELPVTISREEINYADDTVKELILDKINTVYEDLYDRYSKQHIYTDLFEYMDFYYSGDRSLKLTDTVSIPFSLKDNGRIKPTLLVNNKAYRISKDNLSYIFSLFNASFIEKSKVTRDSNFFYLSRFMDCPTNYLYREGEFNHWSNLFYSSHYTVISKRKVTKRIFRELANILNFSYFRTRGNLRETFKIGAAKEVYNFIKFVRLSFKSKLRSYDDVPEDFIKNKKEEQRLLEEERRGNITAYDTLNVKQTLKLERLLTDYKYIFYISKTDDKIKTLHYDVLFSKMNLWFKTQYKFIIISETTIKKLKKFDKVKPVEKVWLVANLSNYFNNIRYSHEVFSLGLDNLNIRNVSLYYYNLYKIASKDVIDFPKVAQIRDFKQEHDGTITYFNISHHLNLYSYFKTQLAKVTRRRNYKKEQAIKELKKVSPCLYLLATATFNYDVDKLKIKNLIKEHKLTKLNPFYYG